MTSPKANETIFCAVYRTGGAQLHAGELAWCSGSVIDCHATAQGSNPSGNGVKTWLHLLHKGQLVGVPSLNDLAVDGTLKHNQPTNNMLLRKGSSSQNFGEEAMFILFIMKNNQKCLNKMIDCSDGTFVNIISSPASQHMCRPGGATVCPA